MKQSAHKSVRVRSEKGAIFHSIALSKVEKNERKIENYRAKILSFILQTLYDGINKIT